MTNTNNNSTQVHSILVWKDASGSWRMRTQAGEVSTAELDTPNLPAVTPTGLVSHNRLSGSQLDLDAITQAAESANFCPVPGTTRTVLEGSEECIAGTWQVCQANGSFRDTGDPC